jgi:hypothetical protein
MPLEAMIKKWKWVIWWRIRKNASKANKMQVLYRRVELNKKKVGNFVINFWLNLLRVATFADETGLVPMVIKLLRHCLWHIIKCKISYKIISNTLANVEYSSRYGQKTVSLIKIVFLGRFLAISRRIFNIGQCIWYDFIANFTPNNMP